MIYLFASTIQLLWQFLRIWVRVVDLGQLQLAYYYYFCSFFGFCFFIIDVDECTASSSMCHENAFCNNTLGSYNCTCKPGYYGDGKTCKGKIGRCLHHSSFQSLIGRDVTPGFVSAKLGINPCVT